MAQEIASDAFSETNKSSSEGTHSGLCLCLSDSGQSFP